MRNRPKKMGKRPRRKTPRVHVPDYKPEWYKPSWNPSSVCTCCGQKLGIKFMPVIFEGMDFHYECMIRFIKERKNETH